MTECKNDNILEGTLHCSGFYLPGVCPSAGDLDYTETRLKEPRRICTTQGQCPLTKYGLCRHCIELQPYLRPRKEVRQ